MGPDPTDVTLGVVQVISVDVRFLVKEDRTHHQCQTAQQELCSIMVQEQSLWFCSMKTLFFEQELGLLQHHLQISLCSAQEGGGGGGGGGRHFFLPMQSHACGAY